MGGGRVDCKGKRESRELSGPITRDIAITIAAMPHTARYFLGEVRTTPKTRKKNKERPRKRGSEPGPQGSSP